MAFLKEEIIEISVLVQKWEKEYIDVLTQMAVDFQEKSSELRASLDRMRLDYEGAEIRNIKRLGKKLEKSKQAVLCCMNKLRRKRGLKKNREAMVQILKEIK